MADHVNACHSGKQAAQVHARPWSGNGEKYTDRRTCGLRLRKGGF
ncbi:MAG TPA: hypothetical protein VHO91_15750 [Rhodopila sp.]|nr:hypothetical protein [Rhodopila sp.]